MRLGDHSRAGLMTVPPGYDQKSSSLSATVSVTSQQGRQAHSSKIIGEVCVLMGTVNHTGADGGTTWLVWSPG